MVKAKGDIDGTYVHPYDCSKYVVCVNNQEIIKSCPAGLRYNSHSKVCDYAYNVDCSIEHLAAKLDIKDAKEVISGPRHSFLADESFARKEHLSSSAHQNAAPFARQYQGLGLSGELPR